MGIKRYTADADTTITNAFKSNLQTRGTGSNMGRADSLEVFSIYGQQSSGSSELTRFLVKFDTTTIAADRANAAIPASGSVNWVLRMFNAVTPNTVPRNFTLSIAPVSGNTAGLVWQEGNGLDMEGYTDITRNGIGANWMNYGSSSEAGLQQWVNVGGDYFNSPSLDLDVNYTAFFEMGTENLEVDISQMVEEFLNSTMTAASVEVTINGTLLGGSTVELTSADGTTVKYKAQAGSGQAVSGSSGGYPITLFGYGSSIANSLTNLSASIANATYGHNGKIDVVIDSGKITLSQATAGRVGNTPCTFEGWEDVTVGGVLPTFFSGGQGLDNYGLGIHLTASQEVYVATADATAVVPANTVGAKRSYYDKKFFARSSEFFYKRPIIEARWNSATKDYRGDFHYSSSLATAAENLNTIYLYNYFRGQLRNIPGIGTDDIYVSIYSGSATDTAPSGAALTLVTDGTSVATALPTVITGGYVSTGIYSASFALTAAATPLEHIYDVWHTGSLVLATARSIQYFTGTIAPEVIELSREAPSTQYVSSITNMKPVYNTAETSRFRVFARQKDWSPSIYTKAVASVPPFVIESGSFAIIRMIDDLVAVQFGTGSNLHTQMSFDVSGSYFDLDMSLLEPGYSYKVKLAYYNGSIGDWQEQPEEFRFRVEET